MRICYITMSHTTNASARVWMRPRVSACSRCFSVVLRSPFHSNIFFGAQNLFVCPLSTLFSKACLSWSICTIFFVLSFVSPSRSVPSVPCVRRSARTHALDARLSTLMVHAKPSVPRVHRVPCGCR